MLLGLNIRFLVQGARSEPCEEEWTSKRGFTELACWTSSWGRSSNTLWASADLKAQKGWNTKFEACGKSLLLYQMYSWKSSPEFLHRSQSNCIHMIRTCASSGFLTVSWQWMKYESMFGGVLQDWICYSCRLAQLKTLKPLHNQGYSSGAFWIILCLSRSHSQLKRNLDFGIRIVV